MTRLIGLTAGGALSYALMVMLEPNPYVGAALSYGCVCVGFLLGEACAPDSWWE